MRNRDLALTISLLLASADAYAVCVDWVAAGRFADIEAADVIFEGTVQQIKPDTSDVCAPDRVVFSVRRVWKGTQRGGYALRQATERVHETVLPDGQHALSGCSAWVEQDTFYVGRSYIVFASGTVDNLESMGCGLSRTPDGQTRRRLDDWKGASSRNFGGRPNKRLQPTAHGGVVNAPRLKRGR